MRMRIRSVFRSANACVSWGSLRLPCVAEMVHHGAQCCHYDGVFETMDIWVNACDDYWPPLVRGTNLQARVCTCAVLAAPAVLDVSSCTSPFKFDRYADRHGEGLATLLQGLLRNQIGVAIDDFRTIVVICDLGGMARPLCISSSTRGQPRPCTPQDQHYFQFLRHIVPNAWSILP